MSNGLCPSALSLPREIGCGAGWGLLRLSRVGLLDGHRQSRRGGDACIALGGGTLSLARATQGSPPRSTPPPPLREQGHSHADPSPIPTPESSSPTPCATGWVRIRRTTLSTTRSSPT